MTTRALLLDEQAASGDDSTQCAPTMLPALEAAGWSVDLSPLLPGRVSDADGGLGVEGSEADWSELPAPASADRRWSVAAPRRVFRGWIRDVLESLGVDGAAHALMAFIRDIELRARRREIIGDAQVTLRKHLLPEPTAASVARLDDGFDGEAAWSRQVRVTTVAYALPEFLLDGTDLKVAATEAVSRHHESPYDLIVVSSPAIRIVATAYLLSRMLEVPLVLSGHCEDDAQDSLPSPVALFRERVRYDSVGMASVTDNRVEPLVELLGRLVREDEVSPAGQAVRPVVSAVLEAHGDLQGIAHSLASLQACTVPNWEALVVVDSDDTGDCDELDRLVRSLDDARIRVFGTALHPFEQYPAQVQHAARSDYFIRMRPGQTVREDFVARVACVVMGDDLAQGHYWTGSRQRSSGFSQSVDKGLRPLRMSLRGLAKWWYSLDGEYVMTWRMFNAYGGFTHMPSEMHTGAVQQALLAEAAALSGLLPQAEVPKAYRRMAMISRNTHCGVPLRERDGHQALPLSAFVEDDAIDVGRRGRYAGRTVLFVRNTLATYDARLLKEAATLMELGARVMVAGVADAFPQSLADAGIEVIHVHDKNGIGEIHRRIRETPPDVVHAYDVLSFDMLEPLFESDDIRLVYECRDLIVAPGYLSEGRRAIERERENQIVRRADAVIAVSAPSAQWIEAAHGIRGVVPILHGSASVVRESVPSTQPVRLLFQGALRPNRGLLTLIGAMERFRGRATLTFQSFGVMDNVICELVDQLGLSEVIDFIPVCGPMEVVAHAAAFDVGIICYSGSTENLLRTSPNKLLDYMSAGLALVAPDLPGVRSLADESHGVFFRPGSTRDLAQAIDRLISDVEYLDSCKDASRARAMAYRWSVEQRKLVEVYDAVLGDDGPATRVTL